MSESGKSSKSKQAKNNDANGVKMRRIAVDAIKGNEKLAMDLINDSGIILMSVGSVIKKEYLAMLKNLGIEYLYVIDDYSKGVMVDEMTEMHIKKQCEDTVKDILERFTYSGTAALENLMRVAEDIILDILEEPEVMYNISGVRQKSENTYSHCVNVCTLSVLIAINMQLPKSKVREIAIGSLLHDIGYNYIPEDYSLRNVDDLTADEKKEIRKHVIYGYSAIEKENWLSAVSKDIILAHHERLDSSGYPFHLKNDRIKIGSKIVAVCDEFDRKVYGFYSPKMKVHETIDYITSMSGLKFDFSVVKTFYDSVAAYPNGTTVVTNEGEIGIVLKQNRRCPTRPVIRIVLDKDGKECQDWVQKDLTENLTLFITDTVDTI